MDVVSGSRLTAAVSLAGGFGILGGGYGEKTWLERELAQLNRCSLPARSPSGSASSRGASQRSRTCSRSLSAPPAR